METPFLNQRVTNTHLPQDANSPVATNDSHLILASYLSYTDLHWGSFFLIQLPYINNTKDNGDSIWEKKKITTQSYIQMLLKYIHIHYTLI